MAHNHSHTPSSQDGNAKRLMLAFGVTATFMIIEVIGGLISGSLALLADAGHMLTDAAALLFGYWRWYLPVSRRAMAAPLAGCASRRLLHSLTPSRWY